jgi:hypothetical protein
LTRRRKEFGEHMSTSFKNRRITGRRMAPVLGLVLAFILVLGGRPAGAQTKTAAKAVAGTYLVNDAHFHLTNYIQEGTDIRDFLAIMGDKVGRSTQSAGEVTKEPRRGKCRSVDKSSTYPHRLDNPSGCPHFPRLYD